MAGKKQAPAKIEEDTEEVESWEDPVVEPDGEAAAPTMRLRDWRDVERYREIKELKQLVDDDLGVEELFENPLKQRPATPVAARPARAATAEKPRPAARPAANHHRKKPARKVHGKARHRR